MGRAAELIETDITSRPRSFLALAPTGTVPLPTHSDVKLWGSAVTA